MTSKYFSLACTIIFLIIINLISRDLSILDSHFSYNPYEAMSFFMELNPSQLLRLRIINAIDLLFLIPSYFLLLYQFTEKAKGRSAHLFILSVAVSADILETTLEFFGSFGHGWSAGWLLQTMSICTPTKWVALLLWGIMGLLLFFRRRFG